jgi:ferritin-like protein
MKAKDISPALPSEATPASTTDEINANWARVVRRRSFLQGLGMAGATLAAGSLAVPGALAGTGTRKSGTAGKLSAGDVAILKFLAAAEIIESDLWVQYAELAGVNGGNPAYIAALENLDEDMPQYITDNTDDEISHALFLNAYLQFRGEQPVNLDAFRTLPSSKATGARQIKRITNLLNLNVDTSWYTRYRSGQNPDLGAHFKGPVTIINQPAIPLNDTDTPPDQSQPVPPETPQQARMQAIANTAGFHFAMIEQGGSSLYATLAQQVTDAEVLRIVISIGGVEIDHFGLWHDKVGNCVAEPLAGVTDPETGLFFPDLNNPPKDLTQTNKILPEPCSFLDKSFPKCSVIRPTSTANSGAMAAVTGLTNDLLFQGQSQAFFDLLTQLATAADAAQRGF